MQAKLTALLLTFMRKVCRPLAMSAADKHGAHISSFTELFKDETPASEDQRARRCLDSESSKPLKLESS